MRKRVLCVKGIVFVVLTMIALNVILVVHGVPLWATLIGTPLFVLFAGRPARPDGPFIWQKDVEMEEDNG